MKTILITGASGNLGYAVTQRLTTQGHKVIAMDASDPRDEFQKISTITTLKCDLSDQKQVYLQLGRLDNDIDDVVLTVGGFSMGSIAETAVGDIRKMITLNFETAYHIVRFLLPDFLERDRGQFILIGARPAIDPNAGKNMAAYSISKKLVFWLSDLINATGKGSNVHSTVVVPSIIDTPSNRSSMEDADFNDWVPASRIAETVSFLLGDAGSMVREGVIKIYNRS